MALVVFLRGVNVGGHRTFRPTQLAAELNHLEVRSLGAAGTFVVRQPVGRAHLRAELRRSLPFEAEIVICEGREILHLLSREPFAEQPAAPDIVHFVSVLARKPRSVPSIPMSLPPTGEWLLRILARENRFVLGLYRRQMRAIGTLGSLDGLFGVPVTTRSWSTIVSIARALGSAGE